MEEKKSWQERYETGDTPWDNNRPDFNLVNNVTSKEVLPGSALEIGCGTGTNSVWLALNGFLVTGIDISGLAIEKATKRAKKADVACRFMAMDFLAGEIEGAPFDFIYDRGCFHSMESEASRKAYASTVASCLKPEGRWLSIIGNADAPPREIGPPTLSAKDIATFVEPIFEILSLTTSHFELNEIDPPRAWVCLMKKRNRPQR